jgi:hypothetical protein
VRQVVGSDKLTVCREVCIGEGVKYGPQLGMLMQAALDAADQRGVPTCCLHQVRTAARPALPHAGWAPRGGWPTGEARRPCGPLASTLRRLLTRRCAARCPPRLAAAAAGGPG